jgi:hypothetical protein
MGTPGPRAKRIVLLALVALATQDAVAQEPGRALRFTMRSSMWVDDGRTVTSAVDIVLWRVSTAADLARFSTLLRDEGAPALREAIDELGPAGTFHEYVHLARPLREWHELGVAFELPDRRGRRRIFILTPYEDQFTAIELRIDRAKGRGTGWIRGGATLSVGRKGGTIAVDRYAFVTQLTDVRETTTPIVPVK